MTARGQRIHKSEKQEDEVLKVGIVDKEHTRDNSQEIS
jgi:hypothetical protein